MKCNNKTCDAMHNDELGNNCDFNNQREIKECRQRIEFDEILKVFETLILKDEENPSCIFCEKITYFVLHGKVHKKHSKNCPVGMAHNVIKKYR